MIQYFSPKLLILLAAVEAGAAPLIDKWGPLLNLGAIGCVLLWFMMQLTPQVKSLVAALDRSTRMSALTIIALDFLPAAVKKQAQQIVNEIDSHDTQRK